MASFNHSTSNPFAGDQAQNTSPSRLTSPASITSHVETLANRVASAATSDPGLSAELQARAGEVMKAAEAQFALSGSWVAFYREMLGTEGLVQRTFPTTTEFAQFQKSKQFAELQEMVAALRSHESSKGDTNEPEKMITIRLPKSLHDALTQESNELNLSINKLCISKLLQRIESRFVPVQQGRRRGRKPGPQGPRKKTSPEQTSDN
ncbi:peptide chain release factor 1 [Rubripirellula reticaptiva]|uniref:HicB family protein n=1 Tax=Rubripirellula reticaptiva TaxID=2528013 RepID=A0A5C6EKG1_9BACT|nr:hypothetical protein [Rubripirellula reticaptiva]TWU48086.1 hypothetical protein Poly59_49310 [Rubripirellula reticaptiva]